MEQKNKFCNKKRSIANRVFSLILVFAMVISNVQTAPGMISTVWAAENETAESGETAERSEASEGEEHTGQTGEDSGGDEKTGTVDKESETDTANSEEESVRSEETTETEGASKPNDEEDKTEVTGTTESTMESTEVSESTDTDETEETTEEINVDEGEGDDTPVAEQVNVVIHFRNSLGWSEVAAHFGKHNGTGWDGDAFSGAWPGITGDDLQKDENGYYTVSREIPKTSGFVIIFNNNDKNEQTQNIVIPSSDFTDVDTYERWVWIEGEMTETDNGNQHTRKNAVISSVPVVSPEIKEDGTVTFRYKNDSATSVKLAGNMTDWQNNAIEMTKDANGIFTYTTTEALIPGTYEYKFIVDGDNWTCDPNNELTGNGNSIFTIEGDDPNKVESPVVKGNKVTFRYKNASAESVYVRGSFNDWGLPEEHKMQKDAETGIHTLEIELAHGAYQYKFYYKDSNGNDQWLPDPGNDQVIGGDNNSYLFVSGDKEYEYTIHYYNPEADVPTTVTGPDLHIWDQCDPEKLVGDYKFTEITTDAEEEGKTWLTMKVSLPYPHINVIARPNGDWTVQDKECTYEIGSDDKAELWYVYKKGLYDKNPFLASYEYTIHYFNPDAPDQASDQSDLYIWEPGTSNPGEVHPFDEELIVDDKENDVTWLTAEIGVPYANIGIIGKPYAGDNNWDGKDSDRKYQLTGDKTEAELWYVHGVGVYDKKPNLNLESIEASLQLKLMNYAQNNVLTIIANGSKDSDVLVKSAYVDASALGMRDHLDIAPDLLAVSLSVRDTIAPGTYDLPVTVEDIRGNALRTTVSVTVGEKSEDNSFDWDEAVIYFMVTDRFFDGNESNNEANGSDGDYNTFGKDNQGLYHGGDFAGVTAKLDYLKDLGVNTIWITPIVENVKGVTVGGTGKDQVPYYAGYHGYWASDFTKLNPALGTDEEFEELIKKAHDKGMKIMVDVVVNHAGYGMEGTDQFAGMLRDSKDVVESDHELGGYQAGLPDFLTEIPEVRDQIIQWQVDWAEKGVDFFRVDTVQHVDSTTWMAFKNALTESNPNFKMIGEYFGAGYNSANGDRLGSGQMDSLLDFNFNEWATEFVKGGISSVENNLAGRNKALNNTYLTGQFLSSHDEDGFKQNLINQGWSESAAAAASYVAATLQITAKGQPVIYYGEEIGLSGNNDYPYQTNRYDFNWSELDKQMSQDGSIYNHYKKMLAIRNDYSEVFAKGDRQVVTQSNADGYDVISRNYGDTTLYVGMNIKSEARTLKLNVNSNGVTGYKDLYSDKVYAVADDGTVEITIPAAADGGTVVLIADSYRTGLVAPELIFATGRTSVLPEQLEKLSEDGEKTLVDVTYSMADVEGITLDNAKKTITVAETFAQKTIELTATAGSDTITFTARIVVDKNEITLRLHYHRPDNNYEGWNVSVWGSGIGEILQFKDEPGGKVTEITVPGRSMSGINFIIRRSTETNEWDAKDPGPDCYVDLSDVLSGTVDYYMESGQYPGTRVLGDDTLIGVKIQSVVYDILGNTIRVTTGLPITGSLDRAFALKQINKTEDGAETEEDIEITEVKSVGSDKNVYELSIGINLSSEEYRTNRYILVYDGYNYDVTMADYSSDEFESRYTYTGDDLGATWSSSKTTFKVWAPTAEDVKVNLYKSGTAGTDDLIETLNMTPGDKGVWTVEQSGDLNGIYYTYSVTVNGETTEACDPYAKTTGVNGDRAMVINMNATNPSGWAADRGPNAGMSYTDSIIYELHVRDFSIDESSGISEKNKGKFLGLTETGTTNKSGQTTGLDYLTDLGVTHIHLLPSYDYATVDETKLDQAQYNWGYDPKNYNVPEGSYSTDPYNGAVRVKEMKQMVKTLHDNNINVIMDVVYNHVYDAEKFCFNQIVPKYFSRTTENGYSNGSGCGNDTASERVMVRKYIVDSVNYWADEYHIDGFRFDLVGLLDVDTINEVVNTVHESHPDVVFYGEGWTMNTAVSKDNITMATQANSAKTPEFAYFSDTIRNLLKGDTFSETSTGFISGAKGNEDLLAKCFTAATDWCKSPTQTINYASCHDNYSLMDKLAVSRGDADKADLVKMNNLAAAIYMTAEGIPLIHAGEELLREKIDEDGKRVENSYNASDLVNSIKWSTLDNEAYRNVRDYYKGLIQFRKNHAALRLTSARDVSANVTYKKIDNQVVMFVINGKDKIKDEVSDGIVVIFNASTSGKEINLYNNYGIAEGEWKVCINDQKAGIETLATITDGKVSVAPISAMVLVKGEGAAADNIYGDNEQQKIEQQRKALQDLIAAYKKLQKGSYTEESWKAFTDALGAAESVAADQAATLDALNKAKMNLTAAYNALAVPEGVVDTEKLRALAEVCKETREQGQKYYTEESWRTFTAALDAAEKILGKTDATQAEVNDAYNKLETGYNGLTKKKPDTASLKDLIAEYEKLEKGNYTDESWAAFTKALAAAKAVVAKPDAAQDEIDSAEEALTAAYDGLTVPEGAVDTAKLKALVFICEAILSKGQGGYTDESWTAFKDALTEAQNVLANTDAEQKDVDAAYSRLSQARRDLSEVHKGIWTKWAADAGLTLRKDGTYHVTYTGKALKPAIMVFDGETQLKEKTDYTVSYKNNTNAGTAEVQIKGKGNYTLSHKVTFNIDPVNIGNKKYIQIANLYAAVASNNSSAVKLKPVVKYNGKTLKLGKDYKAVYAEGSDGKNLGTHTVNIEVLSGCKNFTGSTSITMTLVDKSKVTMMSKVSIGKIPAQDYKGGTVIKPSITVKHGRNVLKEKEHYTVEYDTVHTEAGETATITVRGIIDGGYAGEKTVSFKINGTPLKANMVAFADANIAKNGCVYSGTAQKPAVTVTGVKEQQYQVEYQNNVNAGKATVIVTGRNGYSGTVKKTFKITPYDIFENRGGNFVYASNLKADYAKGGTKLTDKELNARFIVKNDKGTFVTTNRLAQGADFTLSYSNNTVVGTAARVSIKGKGNFKGTVSNVSFTIKAQELGKLQCTAADILATKAKNYNKVIPVITDLNGKKLKKGTDFDVSYTYADAPEETISGTPAFDRTIRVTAKAVGSNYTGSVSADFRIIAKDKNISKAIVKVNGGNPYIYTGSEIEPVKDEIQVKVGTTTLTSDQYEIVGCTNNIKKGTAKLTIHGLGEYGGTKTVTFKIVAQPMS